MALQSPVHAIQAKPLAITKVGVAGGGAMGGGIAQVVADAGLPVVIKDLSMDLVEKGLAAAHEVFDRRVKKGKLSAEEAARKKALVSGTTSYDDFAGCDLVIEAVTEKMAVKKQVFAELDKVLPAHVILASNTSALSISEIASATGRPGKVVGLHYFNPAPVMALVEVVRGRETTDETIATALAFCKATRKTPILVNKDEAGFLVNRLLLTYFNEAVLALEENGADQAEKIDLLVSSHGFPMGPFALADMVGVEVCTHVMHTLHDAFGERFPVARLLDKLVAAGRWGQKRGAGFYSYKDADASWLPGAVAEVQQEGGLKPTPISFERFIAVMINEAARMIEGGVVAKEDVDPAMQMGTGMTQGPLAIADRLGLDEVVRVLEAHRDLGPRFEPAGLLRELVAAGKLGVKSGEGFFAHDLSAGPKRQFVNYVLAERVATVTISHPPANALSTTVIGELEACIAELAADPKCKAIVLTGEGDRFFVAGADINEIARLETSKDAIAMVSKVNDFFCRIENLDKPVIAAINGFCLGGGLELAMSCHVRYIGDRAKVGQPEINLGIIPGFGGSQRLARIAGLARATEWLLTGDMYTAQEALDAQVVNKVCPHDKVLSEAQALARKIASKGAVAIAATLTSLREGRDLSIAQALEVEARQFGRAVETEDKKIGVTGFLRKDPNIVFVDR